MTDPDQPLPASKACPPPLEYGRQRTSWRAEATPEGQRRFLLRCVTVTLIATFAWCFTLFRTRRPALDYFCVCAFIPWVLAVAWFVLGWQLLTLTRRHPRPRRPPLIAVTLLAFFLSPYSLLRAGEDMFTLSLRYHLWRAGGAAKVRGAFNQWVAGRPAYDPSSGQKLLFGEVTPNGSIVRLPATQLPPEVRYIHERYPSRFGMTWNDVAHVDNVSVFTTTDIMFGPPGWEPQGDPTLWDHVAGNRRKLADGIWVQFGVYDK